MKSVFQPYDQNQNVVHAHGGQIIFEDGWYYLIGESRTGRAKVACYRSKDLASWIFCADLLTLDSPARKHPQMVTDPRLEVEGRAALIGTGCNIERPKVLYNPKTRQYVMWMHWELPDDYHAARCAVAVSDTLAGEYTYLGSFNPIGHMSRDCTVFQDDDGTAYFISSARDNADLHIYRLSEDYLTIDRLERVLWPGQTREAPTLFKRNGWYILLTSACTGWEPNQGSYAYSKKIGGDWSVRRDFGDETTFRSQPTWVLPIYNVQTGSCDYWYLGDRWGGKDGYFHSQYVLLPIRFVSDTDLRLIWQEKITPPEYENTHTETE